MICSMLAPDIEAQDHWREKPDLRPVPPIGKENSLAYMQKLKLD